MNKEFEENGFIIVRNFFTNELIKTLTDYFSLKYQVSKYIDHKKNSLNNDIGESYTYYGDVLCESILLSHGQKICNLLKLDLSPTYSYARVYERGDRLVPHLDRVSCEISATCPIFIGDNRPSTIYISKIFSAKQPPISYEKAFSQPYEVVDLYPGDVLFYKGIERFHWRVPQESPLLFQFFMHLVQTSGEYKDYIFDNRPLMGLPSTFRTKKVLDL